MPHSLPYGADGGGVLQRCFLWVLSIDFILLIIMTEIFWDCFLIQIQFGSCWQYMHSSLCCQTPVTSVYEMRYIAPCARIIGDRKYMKNENHLGDWKVQSNNSSALLWNHSKLFIDDECWLKGHYVTVSLTYDLLKSPSWHRKVPCLICFSLKKRQKVSLFQINVQKMTSTSAL